MYKFISSLVFAIVAFLPLAAAHAAPDVHLITHYPSFTARAGNSTTLNVTLQNNEKQPALVDLDVKGLPDNWKAQWLGGGQPVKSAMAKGEDSVSLQLKLDIPNQAEIKPYAFDLVGQMGTDQISLPLHVTLSKELPAKLAVTTKLPALRGAPDSSFDFQFTVKNDSGKDVVAQLAADAPRYFETTFTESYGTQELTSVPIKAGESKDLKLNVKTPSAVKAGKYPVKIQVVTNEAQASTEVQLDIVGQPKLHISGRDGLMSTDAETGEAKTLPLVVFNSGSAPATNVELSSSAPSGWKVAFEPKTIEQIAPNDKAEVQATITPSDKSLVGDYMTTVRASSEGQSTSGDFRVTVKTSSTWGIAGAIIIAIAVLVLVGAVARFGRR
ncbi:hypothetical protein ERD78_00635 [Allopusillimonas soli]|uniref:Alpha-galactosidase NEW3 domain-containing protein n=1 Tax=Allopusillimonas soli TaxID=659016 RepID=A0A853F4G1_9BURK|nr:NEW3 domain-containing protein [Allopusillimonas soli]NYT35365.1 hypothetical protein [Allopusillimonas soli]TEA75783.1 hypothetical protein ERD78_00635 [Allopusillimonas soli]